MGIMDIVPDGFAVRLTKIGYKKTKLSEELDNEVPQRKTHTFALHPKKWESTFYSLTLKDPEKIKFYKPILIRIGEGTLIADMYWASLFLRGQSEFLENYKKSIKPFSERLLKKYKRPELLIP